MDQDSRISAPVLIYVQVSASQAQVVRRSTRHLLRFFNCLCTLHADRGGRQRLVVGLGGPGDLRAHRVVPKSGGRGDNPAAKHYQIAFEFERRGVTGEDGRAGQLECGLWRQRSPPACRGERKARGPFSSRSPWARGCVCRVPRLGPRSVAGEMLVLGAPTRPLVAPPPRPETCSTSTPHALDRSGSDEF